MGEETEKSALRQDGMIPFGEWDGGVGRYKYLSSQRVLHHPGMAASIFPSSTNTVSLPELKRRARQPGNGGRGIPEVCNNRPVDNRELVSFFSELLSTFRLFVSKWGSSQKLQEKVYLFRTGSLAVVVEEKQRSGMWVPYDMLCLLAWVWLSSVSCLSFFRCVSSLSDC